MGWTVDVDNYDEEEGGGGVDLEKRKAHGVDNCARQAISTHIAKQSSDVKLKTFQEKLFNYTTDGALCKIL